MEITLRKATPKDAAAILSYLKQVQQETEFLILTDLDVSLKEYQKVLAFFYESSHNYLCLALLGDEIIGMGNINGQMEDKRQHIGELGISVLKKYWHQGIGGALMEELLFWCQEESQLKRIELYVLQKNKAAIHLYEKNGFTIEGLLKSAILLEDGIFEDVFVMSYLL